MTSFALVVFIIIQICLPVTATDFTPNAELAPLCEGQINSDIYDMVTAYQNGTFVERNDSDTVEPEQIFRSFGVSAMSKSIETIDYIYDLKKLDDGTYEAT